jgi:riboflavin synthase
MKKICVIDTTFSRVDMGSVAVNELNSFAKPQGWDINVTRRTVPGFKDLAVECVRLHDELKFDIALAIGWVGGMPIDAQCAHEAASAIASAQLLLRTHILEVFIHENESSVGQDLIDLAKNRASEHARNALYLLFQQDQLTAWAGTGRRQGGPSAGALDAQ